MRRRALVDAAGYQVEQDENAFICHYVLHVIILLISNAVWRLRFLA